MTLGGVRVGVYWAGTAGMCDRIALAVINQVLAAES
jgi:hypothetical protein